MFFNRWQLFFQQLHFTQCLLVSDSWKGISVIFYYMRKKKQQKDTKNQQNRENGHRKIPLKYLQSSIYKCIPLSLFWQYWNLGKNSSVFVRWPNEKSPAIIWYKHIQKFLLISRRTNNSTYRRRIVIRAYWSSSKTTCLWKFCFSRLELDISNFICSFKPRDDFNSLINWSTCENVIWLLSNIPVSTQRCFDVHLRSLTFKKRKTLNWHPNNVLGYCYSIIRQHNRFSGLDYFFHTVNYTLNTWGGLADLLDNIKAACTISPVIYSPL